MRTFDDIGALAEAVGTHLGWSTWHVVSQDQVAAFADATGDRQWIHVDPERAASGPFGTTVAHGYLTLALLPMLAAEIYRVDGLTMALNYGLNRVRFPAPLPTGSPVRAGITLLEVSPVEGGVQVVNECTLEREGGAKPCCVAQTVSRLYA